MHIGYPYTGEMTSLAKHYPNVYVDLCWAWSVDPYRSTELVRSMIHAAPINKLFAFGGDTSWPSAALAYSLQARTWLARALSAEVNEGLLSEPQAIEVAEYLMFRNQRACFDVEGVRRGYETRRRWGREKRRVDREQQKFSWGLGRRHPAIGYRRPPGQGSRPGQPTGVYSGKPMAAWPMWPGQRPGYVPYASPSLW